MQGDRFSPLLFNMCFITFIQHIKAEKHRQFGFSCKLLNPIHWFQFADDAAVITTQVSENQHLLNRFSIWCQWSNMIIRVDNLTLAFLENPFNIWVEYELEKSRVIDQLILIILLFYFTYRSDIFHACVHIILSFVYVTFSCFSCDSGSQL